MSNSLPSLWNILGFMALQLMEFLDKVLSIIVEDSASLICSDDAEQFGKNESESSRLIIIDFSCISFRL